jgi:Kef-type K+ transport system membrane component KefB
MTSDYIIFSIFLIFIGAAIVSTLALQTRQSLLVAYIIVGIVFGPFGLRLVSDTAAIHQFGEVGIVFLLFLLGLHLQPQSLLHMLKKVTVLTIICSLLFFGIGFCVAHVFGYSFLEAVVVGMTMMFSSTIIGLKLLPTTILHHQHTGEVMIGVLLMQDLLAILVLFGLNIVTQGHLEWQQFILLIISIPLLIGAAYLIEHFVLVKLIARFERIREYIFLLAIAWCLGMAELAHLMHLSFEIGAFFAGVTLAASPIANYIAECLKPLRDFFLVIFFFTIGAGFNWNYFPSVIWPALLLGSLCMLVKPITYYSLLRGTGENRHVAWEVGARLAQTSEFSLLVGYLALSTELISESTNYLIQAMTIITFIVSSYWVAWRYPTPLAFTKKLQKD